MSDYLIAHIEHSGNYSEHICWWRPHQSGYTICIGKAGIYSETEAAKIIRSGSSIAVTRRAALEFCRTTPYYRRSNGDLARLYDGGEHAVVPNSKEVWKSLMAQRLHAEGEEKPYRPTPIGAKSRAIYLPKERGDGMLTPEQIIDISVESGLSGQLRLDSDVSRILSVNRLHKFAEQVAAAAAATEREACA